MSETTSGNETNATVDESQAKQTNNEQNGEEVSAQPSVKEMRAIVLTGFGGQSSLLSLNQFLFNFYLFLIHFLFV
jgi:hypothetical protein